MRNTVIFTALLLMPACAEQQDERSKPAESETKPDTAIDEALAELPLTSSASPHMLINRVNYRKVREANGRRFVVLNNRRGFYKVTNRRAAFELGHPHGTRIKSATFEGVNTSCSLDGPDHGVTLPSSTSDLFFGKLTVRCRFNPNTKDEVESDPLVETPHMPQR